MAQFTGAYPVDQSTPVGMFRTNIGDDIGTQNAPPAQATAEYVYFSDAGIEALLASFPDNADMALGVAMRSVANRLIIAAQDIQVDDIKIKTIEKARLMLEAATGMINGALTGDASAAFDVVPLVSGGFYSTRAEGTPAPWPSL